ncbi:MAG: hypothetical protein JXR10_15530 [Cyclobacteriaceae bacterium]
MKKDSPVFHSFFICFVAASLVFITSCEPKFEEPYTIYTIPKGTHGQSLRIETLQKDEMVFKVVFDESAIYETADPVNQHDLNKLAGFADCNSHHHENSARFGWRWLDGQLEIHAYVYHSGIRTSGFMGMVGINQAHDYRISLEDNSYVFQLDNLTEVRITRENNCNMGVYYKLWPYFGGDEVSPHDIKIKILEER